MMHLFITLYQWNSLKTMPNYWQCLYNEVLVLLHYLSLANSGMHERDSWLITYQWLSQISPMFTQGTPGHVEATMLDDKIGAAYHETRLECILFWMYFSYFGCIFTTMLTKIILGICTKWKIFIVINVKHILYFKRLHLTKHVYLLWLYVLFSWCDKTWNCILS